MWSEKKKWVGNKCMGEIIGTERKNEGCKAVCELKTEKGSRP